MPGRPSIESSLDRATRDMTYLEIATQRNPDTTAYTYPILTEIQKAAREQGLPASDAVTAKIHLARGAGALFKPTAYRGFDYRSLSDYQSIKDRVDNDPNLKSLTLPDFYSEIVRHSFWPVKAVQILTNASPDLAEVIKQGFKRSTENGVRRNNQQVLTDESLIVAILSLLKAGLPLSAQRINLYLGTGTPQHTEQLITTRLYKLPDKLSGSGGMVSDIVGMEDWPRTIPIQTVEELGETLRFYGEKKHHHAYDRLPPDLNDWMVENFDPKAFPYLNPTPKVADVKEIQLTATDLAISRRLLAMDPDNGYKFTHPTDIIPDLVTDPSFRNMDENIKPTSLRQVENYVTNAVFMVPKRYGKAANIRERALQSNVEDPINGELEELFKILETTKITDRHTLAGITESNLYFIFSRIYSFEEMQRKIAAAV